MFKWVFCYKIMVSVYSCDVLLLMLVSMVKCIAGMGFLQGYGTFYKTCVGWLSFDVLLRIPKRGFEEGWLHCKYDYNYYTHIEQHPFELSQYCR